MKKDIKTLSKNNSENLNFFLRSSNIKISMIGMSSKLIPPRFKPKLDGISKEIERNKPIVLLFIFLRFINIFQVGPAGLEPATDGL